MGEVPTVTQHTSHEVFACRQALAFLGLGKTKEKKKNLPVKMSNLRNVLEVPLEEENGFQRS